MAIILTHIHPRPQARLPYEGDVQEYVKLAARWLPVRVQGFPSEATLQEFHTSLKGRSALVLCDSRGKAVTTESLAAQVAQYRHAGIATLIFAIGPANGWSDAIRNQADLLLPFGSLTLPHALARLVLAEQIYRVATILGGHPYHTGH